MTTVPTTTNAPAAPLVEPWGTGGLVSLVLLGGSGVGKTDGIGKIIRAGCNVLYVDVESKGQVLNRYAPLRVNINALVGGRRPTAIERVGRVNRFIEELSRGGYRTHAGRPIDVIAWDGLSETGTLILDALLMTTSAKDTLKMYGEVARRLGDLFRALREAAGMVAVESGIPPVSIVATCGEASPKRLELGAGGKDGASRTVVDHNVPLLPGNAAAVWFPFAFECIWRLYTRNGPGGHEFCVATCAGEDEYGNKYLAKSPPGLFAKVEAGPGGLDDAPDVGAMFKKLLTDEASPFKRVTG